MRLRVFYLYFLRVSSVRPLVNSKVVRLLSVYLSFGPKIRGGRQARSRPLIRSLSPRASTHVCYDFVRVSSGRALASLEVVRPVWLGLKIDSKHVGERRASKECNRYCFVKHQ